MSIVFIDRAACAKIVMPSTGTLRDAMNALNEGGQMFVLVLSSDDHVVGIVTDGDVRRAILKGIDLHSKVVDAMNSKPVAVVHGESAPSLLVSLLQRFTFVPEVDPLGHLRGVHLYRSVVEPPVALIMAGGEGKRLGARTKLVPKPLIEVNGRPMIEYAVDALAKANVAKVFVSVHYMPDAMEKWANTRFGPLTVQLIKEPEPLGTAGALGLLPDDEKSDVIVMNADVLTHAELSSFISFHRNGNLEATIAVARSELQIQFGVVRLDAEGHLLAIDEKPMLTHFIAAGIYILGPRFRALVVPGERLDMPDLLSRARVLGLKVGVFPIHESWRDLGRPVDLEAEEAARRAEARIRK